MNIAFFKCHSHSQAEEYLDMLFTNNLLLIITKPTRLTDHTSTLIGHIYTNSPISQITTGILTVDISDHLPVFCIIKLQLPRKNSKKSFRDCSKFNNELFLNDVNLINWEDILKPDKSLHEKTQDAITALNKIADKHAPMKQTTQTKQKQLNKPWLTTGILRSIKLKKQKMYRTHFLSKDLQKIAEYKQYANMLMLLKHKSKTDYYSTQFSKYTENLKQTWKLIGTLIKRKTKGQSFPTRIIHNNKTFKQQADIAELFNNFFVNVGPNLEKKIKTDNTNPVQYISSSPPNSFYLAPVTESQVSALFAGLNENKAYINVPNKLIKVASGPLSIPFTKIYNESISSGIVPDIYLKYQE